MTNLRHAADAAGGPDGGAAGRAAGLGAAADRMGKKPLLVIASLGLVPVGLGWCFVGPTNGWLGYVLSAAGAALWAGVEVANLNLVLETGRVRHRRQTRGTRGRRATSPSTASSSTSPAASAGSPPGVIAQAPGHWHWPCPIQDRTGYDVLFVLSGVLRLLAVVVFLPHLHEPAARPTREALRYMTANIYNNLFSAVLQPLRHLRLAKRESYVEADQLQ